ncbi:unnamed protein product [Prunus armeniaca]
MEGQEDWTEEYEEEQLDYEPSADDQNALLGVGEQGERTEEYEEEYMKHDGELDAETEAFGAELEDLLQGDLGINMVFILSEKFWATEGQETTLEGDVFSHESLNAGWHKQKKHHSSKQAILGQKELPTSWLQSSFAFPNPPKRWLTTSNPCS